MNVRASDRNGTIGGVDALERAVLNRYADASRAAEPALCCPTGEYDASLLALLPPEIVERDYGCGDPGRYVREGETVVDLGSGAGKICYMLSKRVGPTGRVIGVDFNQAMLDLARRYQDEMARRIGWANLTFIRARIQDMGLDLDALAGWLERHPVTTLDGADALESERQRLRAEAPGVPDDIADVVVSNCVLNLVGTEEKDRLFAEIFRVLRKGGRAVISDIVCDETPPPGMRSDPHLWSGCIAGAFREDEFLERFERAGFHGVEILERAAAPWQVINGIEFRSMTVRAFKGKAGPCFDHDQAVVYRGPWKRVVDDDGHVLLRGKRMAVCDKTYRILTDARGPYAGQVIGVEPLTPVDPARAPRFACEKQALRDPRRTKGVDYRDTVPADGEACCTDGSCG
ncbi:MAG: methyltransferase domain-containing protein [Phycisphaeraceae bacterium]|nr:methyltransferase domain-containing protein [Phycisphaeraceae bacterium]